MEVKRGPAQAPAAAGPAARNGRPADGMGNCASTAAEGLGGAALSAARLGPAMKAGSSVVALAGQPPRRSYETLQRLAGGTSNQQLFFLHAR